MCVAMMQRGTHKDRLLVCMRFASTPSRCHNAPTGVATSSLYVLCDGGQASGACTVSLTDCTLRNNKLLLQPALDPENLSPPGFLGTIFDPEPGPGKKLLDAMVPWLTYTYPLLQYWKTVRRRCMEAGKERSCGTGRWRGARAPYNGYARSACLLGVPLMEYLLLTLSHYLMACILPQVPDFRWFGLQDAANLPSVTGRTLGAVVVHSRNAPSPGLAPDRPPVLSVTVTGGEYSGNDGAALMSTATGEHHGRGAPRNIQQSVKWPRQPSAMC